MLGNLNGNLVLTRYAGEGFDILLDDEVIVRVVLQDIKRSKVSVSIGANKELKIVRTKNRVKKRKESDAAK